MDVDTVRGYFNEASTVSHYARAVASVGLWESEKRLLDKYFPKDGTILDLGCGAGRATIGLWEAGFQKAVGADLAEGMVNEARSIAACLGCPFRFEAQDATQLNYADGRFDGVLFLFNGLMQIPGRSMRLQALREIRRTLKPGGRLMFSTLDREDRLYSRVFARADDPEHDLRQNPHLLDYGDRHFVTEHGMTFMHVPTRREVEALVAEAGFTVLETAMRSEIARESAAVREFSEDCRMWVAKKA